MRDKMCRKLKKRHRRDETKNFHSWRPTKESIQFWVLGVWQRTRFSWQDRFCPFWPRKHPRLFFVCSLVLSIPRHTRSLSFLVSFNARHKVSDTAIFWTVQRSSGALLDQKNTCTGKKFDRAHASDSFVLESFWAHWIVTPDAFHISTRGNQHAKTNNTCLRSPNHSDHLFTLFDLQELEKGTANLLVPKHWQKCVTRIYHLILRLVMIRTFCDCCEMRPNLYQSRL